MSFVPAWKRLGLKVKQTLDNDPLSLTTHIESPNLTSKQAKQVKKRQREADNKTTATGTKTSKAPKRLKLPKSERGPAPEKDQLFYLKQYHQDRTNWKFSKQKQNWILKNIREIPEAYDEALKVYVNGIQGASRDRLATDMKTVVEEWNKSAEEAQRLLEEAAAENKPETTNNDDEDEKPSKAAELEANKLKKETEKKQNSKEVLKKELPPDVDYATRARNLYLFLNGKKLFLHSVDIAEATAPEIDEPIKADESEQAEELGQTEELEKKTKMIVEDVEVSEYVDDRDFEDIKEVSTTSSKEGSVEESEEKVEKVEKVKSKKDKKEKKHKKEKKNKKKKDN